MAINKGFIKDWAGNTILPITRGELVLDIDGNIALNSKHFLAKEGHPGLVTAAERALLSGISGSDSTQGISDIYTKLGLINNGLLFGGKTLNFYNASGTGTPINVTSTGDGSIAITNSSNTVNLSLAALTDSGLSASNILKSITVDKFGRVTAVSGSALTNDEIPAELSEKTISSSVLDGCLTSNKEIGSDEKAIANKAYVDAKFLEVTGIATGALKFGGALSTKALAEAALADENNNNNYYKVTASFELNKSNLYDTTGIYTNTITVYPGDTLIIHTVGLLQKFVYVPSGDDKTLLTITSSGKAGATGNTALSSKMGDLTLRFDYPFSVQNADTTNNSSNTAIISMPYANATTDGYLSSADWNKFNSYASDLGVTYTNIATGEGRYEIGTINIGGTDNTVYGLNNISSFTLTNGVGDGEGNNTEYNPILTFTETGSDDVNVTLKGTNGIIVQKSGNDVVFSANNIVVEQDVPQPLKPRKAKYLTITNGYSFGVTIGSANPDGTVAVDGLTDFSQFNALVNKVGETVCYEDITHSLISKEGEEVPKGEYRYGNDALKAAVQVTI